MAELFNEEEKLLAIESRTSLYNATAEGVVLSGLTAMHENGFLAGNQGQGVVATKALEELYRRIRNGQLVEVSKTG